MEKILAKIKHYRWWLVAALYFVVGVLLIPAYAYHLQTDGISYIAIARRYAQGDWYGAINAYWPPLFSWLLAPLLLFIKNAVVASKIISLIVGWFVVDAVRRLTGELKINGPVQVFTVIAVALLTVYFAMAEPGPDLIVLAPLLYYVYFVLRVQATKQYRLAAYAGIAMAVACWAKNFSLPFLLAHTTVVAAVTLYHEPAKKQWLRLLGVSIAIMFVGVASWSVVLFTKYHLFTLGTSGAYNQALVGPQSPGLAIGHVFYHRLSIPDDPTAISVWEDPSKFSLPTWSPLESRANFKHQLSLLKESVYNSFLIYRRFSIFAFAILGLYIFSLASRSINIREKQHIIIILAALFIYNAGYALLFVEQRYLWFNWILMVLMAGWLLARWQHADLFKYRAGVLLAIIVLGSFVAAPFKLAWQNRYSGYDNYVAATQLEAAGMRGAIASNYCPSINQSVLGLAYYTGNQYYGLVDPAENPEGVLAALRANHVKYYIVGCGETMAIPGLIEFLPGVSNSFDVYQLP